MKQIKLTNQQLNEVMTEENHVIFVRSRANCAFIEKELGRMIEAAYQNEIEDYENVEENTIDETLTSPYGTVNSLVQVKGTNVVLKIEDIKIDERIDDVFWQFKFTVHQI